MAELADPPTSTSSISTWFDYLTAPATGGSRAATEERYVVAAVLADETIVRIDDGARWFPASGVYRSTGAKLDLPLSARGADGVFTIDSGLYRVMTANEYADVKRVEAARAEAAAAAAVSSPRATRAPSPHPPEQGLASLVVSGDLIGCGAHARMVTVVSVGPNHVGAALRRAAPVIEQAQKADNEVVTVVLGVADELEAQEALHITGRRVLLAGGHELAHLRRGREATGPMRAYLREAVLLECLAGSGNGVGLDGDGGVWVLPARAVPLTNPPHALEERDFALGMVGWKDALNKQWREWYGRFSHAQPELLGPSDTDLLHVYANFSTATVPVPRLGLPPSATACVGLDPAPPFGIVDHTIRWRVSKASGGERHAWPEPKMCWTSTGGGPASVYWTITTWCSSTRTALRVVEPTPALDLQTDEDELQWEVETTIASLALYKTGGETPFRDPDTFDALKGVLGPVVYGGRGDTQPMRVVWWTLAARPGGVLMLLPEAYVRMAIEGYPTRSPTAHGRAFLCVQGFLVLADADALPLQFGDSIGPEEALEEARALGTRLWIPNGATAAEAHHALADVSTAPKLAAPLPTFRTRRDSDTAHASAELVPGTRVPGTRRGARSTTRPPPPATG